MEGEAEALGMSRLTLHDRVDDAVEQKCNGMLAKKSRVGGGAGHGQNLNGASTEGAVGKFARTNGHYTGESLAQLVELKANPPRPCRDLSPVEGAERVGPESRVVYFQGPWMGTMMTRRRTRRD